MILNPQYTSFPLSSIGTAHNQLASVLRGWWTHKELLEIVENERHQNDSNEFCRTHEPLFQCSIARLSNVVVPRCTGPGEVGEMIVCFVSRD
jgi:hypothetical protein